jgi:signal transduction histidine kinase
MEPKETLMNIRQSIHDLNQPLTAAIGLIYLMFLKSEDNTKIYQDLITLNDQIEKIKKITEHIQYIARSATQDKNKDSSD